MCAFPELGSAAFAVTLTCQTVHRDAWIGMFAVACCNRNMAKGNGMSPQCPLVRVLVK